MQTGRRIDGCVKRALLALLATATVVAGPAFGAELLVGGATVSITPRLPVGLSGQRQTRIAREVESEVVATALALSAPFHKSLCIRLIGESMPRATI